MYRRTLGAASSSYAGQTFNQLIHSGDPKISPNQQTTQQWKAQGIPFQNIKTSDGKTVSVRTDTPSPTVSVAPTPIPTALAAVPVPTPPAKGTLAVAPILTAGPAIIQPTKTLPPASSSAAAPATAMAATSAVSTAATSAAAGTTTAVISASGTDWTDWLWYGGAGLALYLLFKRR